MIRFFDILCALLAILLLLPVFLIIALLLKMTGEGAILYCQERIGRNARAFKVYKFATMLKNSPNIGARLVTTKNDPRVLPIGKFLRKSKINELPQLFNIILGDMSIIGPRPLTRNSFEAYSPQGRAKIYANRPGLSGIGSIVFRDEESLLNAAEDFHDVYKKTITPYKEEVELWYANHANLFLYFALIFLTVWVVLVPASKLIWIIFPALPKPKGAIAKALGF